MIQEFVPDESLMELVRRTPGFLSDHEARVLYDAAVRAAERGPIVEIGSYCGKSTLLLGAAAKSQSQIVLTIDHHRGSAEHQPDQRFFDPRLLNAESGRIDTLPFLRRVIDEAGLESTVLPIVARSESFARVWRGPLGMVFIDGSHAIEDVLADLQAWAPHLVWGGLLAIHDVSHIWPGPVVAYRQAISSGRFGEVTAVGSLRILERTTRETSVQGSQRILVAVPHFFGPESAPRHGSEADGAARLASLTACLSSVARLSGRGNRIIDIAHRTAVPADQGMAHQVDIVVCTTGNQHLLEQYQPVVHFQHRRTDADPRLLGFECQGVFRENLDRYDYFCFLEDDLVIHDPLFLTKIEWFTQHTEDASVLLPNRYEVSHQRRARKLYIDGDIRRQATERFQNIDEVPGFAAEAMGKRVTFRRPLNPHAGCYFLTAKQMRYWTEQPYFLDRDTSFIGPLESAATLGVMRTFRIYKPAPENASWLEIQHSGTAFLDLVATS